jgi:hypothetical protein
MNCASIDFFSTLANIALYQVARCGNARLVGWVALWQPTTATNKTTAALIDTHATII